MLKKTLLPIVSAFLAEQVKVYMNSVGMISASIATKMSFNYLNFWSSYKEMNFFVKVLYGGFIENLLLLLIVPVIASMILTSNKCSNIK